MSVYVWGFGKNGQIGNGQTETVHTPVKPRISEEISYIDCGGYYTAVITTSGQLVTFGCAKYGRLGTGNEADRTEPVKIKCDGPGFKMVSCGIWHGAAVSTDNNIYMWGYGKGHGVLGSPDIPHMSPPKLLSGPFNNKVAGVACGNNYTLLWTTDGEAYSWGCGRHGVLGHGVEGDQPTPKRIEVLKSENITYMNAGFTHCGAVTSDGNVYMCGKGEDQALGLGSEKNAVPTPTVVSALYGKDIVELSCSLGEKHGHTLFVSKGGQVYACGDGYKGKLGVGDQESRKTPTMIADDTFNGEKVAHVAAGGIHSAAVSQEGHVFTWGCGSDGRLGHPDGKGHRYLFRSDIPRVVEDLVKVGQATTICCSYYHTAALVKPN